jgi:hypothetical protein
VRIFWNFGFKFRNALIGRIDHYVEVEGNQKNLSRSLKKGFSQRPAYPRLAKMAFDILTIPALRADCERMFSELGHLLEARRMKIRPQLISAIQCSKAWLKKPFIT